MTVAEAPSARQEMAYLEQEEKEKKTEKKRKSVSVAALIINSLKAVCTDAASHYANQVQQSDDTRQKNSAQLGVFEIMSRKKNLAHPSCRDSMQSAFVSVGPIRLRTNAKETGVAARCPQK